MANITIDVGAFYENGWDGFLWNNRELNGSSPSYTINIGDNIRIFHRNLEGAKNLRNGQFNSTPNGWQQLTGQQYFVDVSAPVYRYLRENQYTNYFRCNTAGTFDVHCQFYVSRGSFFTSDTLIVRVTVRPPYVQYTGGRNMRDIGNFLGDPNPKSIADWYRGRTYVKQLDGRNNGIPTSGTISLNQFSGVWK